MLYWLCAEHFFSALVSIQEIGAHCLYFVNERDDNMSAKDRIGDKTWDVYDEEKIVGACKCGQRSNY